VAKVATNSLRHIFLAIATLELYNELNEPWVFKISGFFFVSSGATKIAHPSIGAFGLYLRVN